MEKKNTTENSKTKFETFDWVLLLGFSLFFGTGIAFMINSALAAIFHYSLHPSEFPFQWIIIVGIIIIFTIIMILLFGPKKRPEKEKEHA